MASIAKEVEAIVSLIGEVNSSIQKIGAGWFRSGREIELYQVKARILEDRLNTWSGLVHSHGLNDHQVVKPILELADSIVKCLVKEAAHLKELRHSCCMRYQSFLMRSVFPRDLSPKLKSVGTAFQTLEAPLLDEIMKATNVNLRNSNYWANSSRLAFSPDMRYVPIQLTVDEVIEALERKDSSHVVTLSGGAGTGKTALVKALALAYQDMGKRAVEVDLLEGSVGETEKPFVNGIVYIDCGNEGDSRLKIVELLHSLGSHSQVTTEDNKESESHTEEVLRRRLSARLEHQEVLVILDDVGNSEFLQQLLVPGKNVKYLITTQDSGLCTRDFSNHNIVMQKPQRKEAEAIFLEHIVNSPDEIISWTELEVVKTMMKEAEDNPVVLKNLAVAISRGSKYTVRDLAHCQSVLKKFQNLTAGQVQRNGMVHYIEEHHRKGVLCSFELAMDSMPMEAQHLLLLAAHCEGPSVPELVLSLFHRITSKGPLNSFSKWTDYVENRDFIKLHEYVVPWCKSPKRMWSIQSLRYISRKIAKSVEEMNMLTHTLLADNPQPSPTGSGDYSFCVDDKLVAALCFVYGEKNLSAKAAIKLTIMTPTEGRGFLRLAVEPVVWLLHCDHEIEEEWEQKAYWSARQVLITYITEGKLDDAAAQELLSIPQAASAMSKMLQVIGETGKRSVLSADTPMTLQSLLKLLTRDADSNFELQRRAAETLASLADKSHRVILAEQCILERLMKLLAKDVKSPVQAGAALALGKLAVTDDIRWKIATYPGIMPKLAELMDQQNDCQVQENATYAFSRLALNPHIVPKIVDIPGSLKKFSFLLSLAVNTAVQVQATKALANLARVEKVTHRILVHSGILSSTVRLLEEETGSAVQLQATRLLVNLSACQDNHCTICKHPGAITAVVARLKPGLSSSIDPDWVAVQENAAKILANLSSGKDGKTAVVETPDALKYLFALADDESQPELRNHTTKCLANLAYTALEADRSRDASCPNSRIVNITSLTPEQRQTLMEFVAVKSTSTAGSKRHDLQSNGDSGRRNNGDPEDGWRVLRLIKDRWCRMVRFRLTLSSGQTQNIKNGPTASHLPVPSPRGALIEVQLPPTTELMKSFPREGELDPSRSMKGRVTGPSSFRSPER